MIGKMRHATPPSAHEARGVLVPRFDQGRFSHDRQAPCAALAALVEHYWHVAWDMRGNPPQAQETLPHPNVHLVVEHDAAGIYGVHTARYTKQLAGQGFAFGIKFRPGGFQPFLGAPLATIADSRLAPDTVFAGAGLDYVRQIRACADAPARFTAAEAFLLARLPQLPIHADVARANALVAAIAADTGMLTVDALAEQAGLNQRSLQRLFQHYVGVSPKWVIKRYRMHEAVAQLQAGMPVKLAQLALDLGYFDQAHFINEFTALVGKPPGEYLRQLSASPP
jgi:AraC-like DNA-binding protein